MDWLEWLFVLGMFTPGIIRGAFWYDSPSLFGVFWTVAMLGLVVVVGWLVAQITGDGIGPTIAMLLFIIAANVYAIRGSTFSSSHSSGADIDGDANE